MKNYINNIDNIKWDSLSQYTPIEYTGEYCGSHIYMKRDDKLPFSYGGNKVRIAHELMMDIKAGGYTAVISYGSESSNMNRAIADMAKAYGIKCYVIIKTEAADANAQGAVQLPHEAQENDAAEDCSTDAKDIDKAQSIREAKVSSQSGSNKMQHAETENERIVKASGAELIYCTGSNVRDSVEATLTKAKADGYKAYYIYGDSTGSGTELSLMRASYKEYGEIKNYELKNGLSFDAIVLTAGTGMTIAGLAAAVNDELADGYPDEKYLALSQLAASNNTADYTKVNTAAFNRKTAAHAPKLIGISAARTTANSLSHIRNDLLTYYQSDENRIIQLPQIIDSYLCGGYGRYNAEIEQLIHHMEDIGTALDPTYTGKSYWGLLNEIKAGSIKGNILFIHTGGYPVYLDWKTKCEQHN